MTRIFWISFWAAIGVYVTMVTWSLPFIALSADGLAPFDVRPIGYSFDEASRFLTAITEEGRVFYKDIQLKLDLLYPALLCLALILGFQILLGRRWATIFGLVALMGAASDYFENYLVLEMLNAQIDRLDENLVGLASFWTKSKSIATTICFTVLVAGSIRAAYRRWFR
ncbi:hypothetical protein ACMAZE_06795 [Pseudopelagicola sp. nBUS_20]|uniref:hypothetical protein n=1 Tax=Pseudopelagicola sp. nBUS_20 TaxID=3395317 RepID=UPI003EBFC6AE